MDETGRKIVEFIPSFAAVLNVHTSEVAERPISKYLFGKFAEHLGQNTYDGIWAQILENPSFEPCRFFADKIGEDNPISQVRPRRQIKSKLWERDPEDLLTGDYSGTCIALDERKVMLDL